MGTSVLVKTIGNDNDLVFLYIHMYIICSGR